jgi:hypothetical protein
MSGRAETTEGIAAAAVAADCCCGRGLLIPSFYLANTSSKMQPGMNFNVNSNPHFRFCLTGIQILSVRFSKCRFVYDLNRYF